MIYERRSVVSRELRHWQSEQRARKIAMRVCLTVFLLFLGLSMALLAYFFLGYTDQIAANTHDHRNLIGTLGIDAVFISFASFAAVPFVVCGLHETHR